MATFAVTLDNGSVITFEGNLTGDIVGAGSPVVRQFPVAFNSPGILTGHTIFTPTPGDVLLDLWVQITESWDGTTPFGDVGQFGNGVNGWFGSATNPAPPLDMTASPRDPPVSGDGYLVQPALSSLGYVGAVGFGVVDALQTVDQTGSGPLGLAWKSSGFPLDFGSQLNPGYFSDAAPIKMVISQDGTIGGASPGSTKGSSVVYMVTATPI